MQMSVPREKINAQILFRWNSCSCCCGHKSTKRTGNRNAKKSLRDHK